MLQILDAEDRPPEASERRTLNRWSGWGATPELFDARDERYGPEREALAELVGEAGVRAARRTILNAHYTDSGLVRPMWEALAGLALPEDALVLEPGCGAGAFMAEAPQGTRVVGVELDPTTARIARALYPWHEVRAEGFEATRIAEGTFDAVIGNVPFGDFSLHDPTYNPTNESIHNHFVLKALALTRPGGVAVVLASRYLLDARSQRARDLIAERADLLGAVRLPRGAHRRAAGTDVVTDVLVLRRREPGHAPLAGGEWTRTVPLAGLDPDAPAELRVSAHFAAHPEMVLGDLASATGRFGPEVSVAPREGEDLAAALSDRLRAIAERAREAGALIPARAGPRPDLTAPALARVHAGTWAGHMTHEGGRFYEQRLDGGREPVAVPATQAERTLALMDLRDRARAVLEIEAAREGGSPELEDQRAGLRAAWEAYVARHGPINRFTETRRAGPGGEEVVRRRNDPAVQRFARIDPNGALVKALEVFDERTQTAAPAALLTGRVLHPRTPVTAVETPEDAVAVCLDQLGRLDEPRIAGLLGIEAPDVEEALGDLAYRDPETSALIPAEEYLSGDVRAKLALVEPLVEERPELARNARALRDALPPEVPMGEIAPRLGAVWIDARTYREFFRETFEDPTFVVEHGGGSVWAVRGRGHGRLGAFDTERMAAKDVALACLRQQPIVVYDTVLTLDDQERRVVNAEQTAQANDKAERLQERFSDWLWRDPDRASRLHAEYNRRFNSIVLRDYSGAGKRLSLPGLAASITPRPHQRAAVARMLAEPSVGLFHGVGAGKTLEMAMGASELRRLGMVRKPVVVVPNHMLEQFSREWLQAYPQARILAAGSEDLPAERRREFVARVATHDWDAVIMTRTAFERLPVDPESEQAWIARQVDDLRARRAVSEQGAGLTARRLERMAVSTESKLRALRDHRVDPATTFEATGIDYVIVDEAHDFKNLETDSRIPEAKIAGAKRATDLALKLELLRARHGGRVATFATATPLANSLTEAHVMCRYLRPDLLRAAGVEDFDAWAATFTESLTALEVGVAGDMRTKTRLARFQNVPEMLRMWHTFADVRRKQDLGLDEPVLWPRSSDGARAPEVVVVEAGDATAEYVAELAERAERVRSRRVEPREDNMLKISTDGRKAALDLRMVDPEARPEAGKLAAVAEAIARIDAEHAGRTYLTPLGEESAQRGPLQVVFLDLGTPGGAGFDAYEDLRRLLAARGIPRERVRFAHEAKSDAEKAALFEQAREGGISVLIGSTQKMGVGTNIQRRLIALHHVDCPWRPADVEQRDGRGVRQGNENPEIGIYRYVTAGTFDAFMWQTVERKARFIAQIMNPRNASLRTVEDIGGDETLSFSEVKALATGDPLVLEHARASAELERLERLRRAHLREIGMLERSATEREARAHAAREQIGRIRAAIASHQPTTGEDFRATIAGQAFTEREAAAAALGAEVRRCLPARGAARAPIPLGTVGGVSIEAHVHAFGESQVVEIELTGLGGTPAQVDVVMGEIDGPSALRKIEARANRLDQLLERAEESRERLLGDARRARQGADAPFAHARALAAARTALNGIEAQMREPADGPAAGREGVSGGQAPLRLDRAAARSRDEVPARSPAPGCDGGVER